MADFSFAVKPGESASEEELLEWLEKARNRDESEIQQNLYTIEEVYGRLDSTTVGAVTDCETQQNVAQKLDQYAHCSSECEICHKSHCLPRDATAQGELAKLKDSIDQSKPWVKDTDPHFKVLDTDDNDVTLKGHKAALNQFRETMNKGVMIGALVCEDEEGNQVVLYGTTGSFPKFADKYSQPIDGFITTADGKKLARNIRNDGEFNVLSGDPILVSTMKGNGNPPGACAAQRMLQQALALKLTPISLAESWYGKSKEGNDIPRRQDHLCASCTTCRKVLSVVLCPDRTSTPKTQTESPSPETEHQ